MKISVSIPEPCHERWDQMTPTERGRFCAVCRKQVTDFSALSNSDLHKALLEGKTGSCGRFSTAQLDSVLQPAPTPWRSLLKSIAASIMLVYAAVAEGRAQTGNAKAASVEVPQGESGVTNKVSGCVVDYLTGEAIRDVEVTIKSLQLKVMTNKDGYFFIALPDTVKQGTRLFLDVGYTTQSWEKPPGTIIPRVAVDNLAEVVLYRYPVAESDLITIVTKTKPLQNHPTCYAGGYVVTREETRWQKFKRFFTKRGR